MYAGAPKMRPNVGTETKKRRPESLFDSPGACCLSFGLGVVGAADRFVTGVLHHDMPDKLAEEQGRVRVPGPQILQQVFFDGDGDLLEVSGFPPQMAYPGPFESGRDTETCDAVGLCQVLNLLAGLVALNKLLSLFGC